MNGPDGRPPRSEGYLVIATGSQDYLDMAANLAASIRIMDPGRRICLLHDEAFLPSRETAKLFDDLVILHSDPLFPGYMNKLRLYDFSPYQEAMVVDADCLMVKNDIQRYWDWARRSFFTMTGGRSTTGSWKGLDVAPLLEKEGIPYLIRMNSGVFYFRMDAQAEEFFSGLKEFYVRRRDHIEPGLHRGLPAQTDEIYFGLYLGLCGMDMGAGGQFEKNSWMVSTWRAFGMRFHPDNNVAVIRKPRHSIAGIPNPLTGWDKLSPTFAHFIGLRPKRLYRRLSRDFRARALDGHGIQASCETV